MFLKERQDSIVELVSANGRAAVSDLAERFGVTEDCIRKDLKTLSDQGLVRRVHGGAISVDAPPERNVRKRVSRNAADKLVIAERAYALIEEGDTVFLDISTTNLALAELMAAGGRRMTVVSNMIDILQALAPSDAVTCVGTGGTVSRDLNGFLGAYPLSFLTPMRFDRAFIGALGIDDETGDVYTFDLDDGLVKQLAIRNAAHAYLVADHRKFGAGGTYLFANLADFEAVITDR